MEILQAPGKFEVLGLMGGINGESPLELIEVAGRTAYQSQEKITEGSAEKFVKMLRDRKHESVLEHSCMMVRFSDVSRGLTHEQVRHRLTSPTQESTRYVDESNLRVIAPPGIDSNKKIVELIMSDGKREQVSFEDWVVLNQQMYRGLRRAGLVPEDARQVLPIGVVAQIVITANFREWRHIFELRCSPQAHWEIRMTMVELLKQVQRLVPIVFDDFVVDKNIPSAKIVRN
jgi:thymidylate synthase (FAD)